MNNGNLNLNLVVENAIKIKSQIMINVDVSAKIISCDEIIGAEAKSNNEEAKKKQPVKHKISIFYLHFYQLV